MHLHKSSSFFKLCRIYLQNPLYFYNSDQFRSSNFDELDIGQPNDIFIGAFNLDGDLGIDFYGFGAGGVFWYENTKNQNGNSKQNPKG